MLLLAGFLLFLKELFCNHHFYSHPLHAISSHLFSEHLFLTESSHALSSPFSILWQGPNTPLWFFQIKIFFLTLAIRYTHSSPAIGTCKHSVSALLPSWSPLWFWRTHPTSPTQLSAPLVYKWNQTLLCFDVADIPFCNEFLSRPNLFTWWRLTISLRITLLPLKFVFENSISCCSMSRATLLH